MRARDPSLFMRKWMVAKKPIDDVDVACIQEVHGTEQEMQLTGQRMQATHVAFVSACDTPGAGGVMTFLHKRWAGRGPTEAHQIVPGRILVTTTSRAGFTLVTVGVHNFDISTRDIRRLDAVLREYDTSDDRTVIVLAGNWNFGEDDDATMTTTKNETTTSTATTRRWRRVLRRMTALAHGVPTRAVSTTTDAGPQVSYASLDRAYVSLQPTTLAFRPGHMPSCPDAARPRNTDDAASLRPPHSAHYIGCPAPPTDGAPTHTAMGRDTPYVQAQGSREAPTRTAVSA